MSEKDAGTSTGLPWKVGSRSYNIAVELIKSPLPRNIVQKKAQLLALELKNGASRSTMEHVIGTLRKRILLPEYANTAQNSVQIREIVHETAHGTAENSEKKGKIVTDTAEAVHDTADALQKTVADTAEKSEVLQKNVQETALQGNVLVLPAEVVEALKKVNALDEKFNNLPETIKQDSTNT